MKKKKAAVEELWDPDQPFQFALFHSCPGKATDPWLIRVSTDFKQDAPRTTAVHLYYIAVELRLVEDVALALVPYPVLPHG